ncbi:MAG TPA: hypothetical protein VI479_02445, partial [Blastocatellia bacterium]
MTMDNSVSVVLRFGARHARGPAFQCFPQFSIALPIEQIQIEITPNHSGAMTDMREPSSLPLGSRLCLVHFERFSMQVVTVEFLF